MAATRFRKKPVVIEAMQWADGFLHEQASSIIEWVLAGGGTARLHDDAFPWFIAIDTMEGTMHALPNYWVIRGVQGEFYGCEPSIFEATYERVTEATAPSPHVHSWRVEGDDEIEPYHTVCEDCGATAPSRAPSEETT